MALEYLIKEAQTKDELPIRDSIWLNIFDVLYVGDTNYVLSILRNWFNVLHNLNIQILPRCWRFFSKILSGNWEAMLFKCSLYFNKSHMFCRDKFLFYLNTYDSDDTFLLNAFHTIFQFFIFFTHLMSSCTTTKLCI